MGRPDLPPGTDMSDLQEHYGGLCQCDRCKRLFDYADEGVVSEAGTWCERCLPDIIGKASEVIVEQLKKFGESRNMAEQRAYKSARAEIMAILQEYDR